jgi:hypothetical protein
MPLDLGHEQAEVASSAERHHPELLGEIFNDLQRLGAD